MCVRALIESDLGMTPSSDGTKIRINVPMPTEERRKQLVKTAKTLGEESKVLRFCTTPSEIHVRVA